VIQAERGYKHTWRYHICI